MIFTGDLHIHSHFSLATSKQLTPQYLDYWAKIKGVNLVGTGDFTHPKWTEELQKAFEPAEDGLFKLKDELILPDNPVNQGLVRFILTAEISNIYKKNGKVRKIHNVVVAPDFQTVLKIQKTLSDRKFNITSDGRPILGLDSRDLLEMMLEINENIIFIPAHIWTPWFAALGSKSGFDSIEEAYGDLTKYIYAVETGLSSDQPLNWLCSFLDKFTLISNSDAHSPEKLGRNANIFNTELSYNGIVKALKNQDTDAFVGTIDLYPQEGKYHYDGHRKCGVRFNPTETMEHAGICPVCGGKLTLGVAHRIAELADRNNPQDRPIKKDFKYVIPLKEIIAEIKGVRSTTKSVDNLYFKLVRDLGSELDILLNIDIEDIKRKGGEVISVAIDRMRQGKIIIEEGYDGEYGKIKVFEKNEIKNFGSKKTLFDIESDFTPQDLPKRPLLAFDVAKFRELKKNIKISEIQPKQYTDTNTDQKKAIEYNQGNVLVIAGPGTGKTYTLTERITHLINIDVKPEKILAITFSRFAANEIKQRIAKKTDENTAKAIKIKTFHALGLEILRKIYDDNLLIINEQDKKFILLELGVPKNKINKLSNEISLLKNTLSEEQKDNEFLDIFSQYTDFLINNKLLDFDDLVYLTIKKLDALPEEFDFQHILIDEFQDINRSQYEFLRKLRTETNNFFAIGDTEQAIYGFRGSDAKLLDLFIKEFNAQLLHLNKSYRCTDNILSASKNIVKSDRKISGIDKGIKITITRHPSDKSEAEYIARTIEDMIGGLRFFSIDSNVTKGNTNSDIKSLSDFAVLLRTKALADTLIKAFNDHSIPYQIIDNQHITSIKPFDDLIAVIKFFANPENNFLRKRVKVILGLIPQKPENNNTTEILKNLWKKYFEKKYKSKSDDFEKIIKISTNKKISDFLKEIELLNSVDNYNPNIEAVNVMTLHASKGLEFQCVFIPALEDGIIPYKIFNKETDENEERRLLYVGMTRSKKFLYLSSAQMRMIKNMRFTFKRSSFVDDIEKNLLLNKKQNYKKKKDFNDPTLF